MDLTLTRTTLGSAWTIGELELDGSWECYTLEDQVHTGAKVPGETAIPLGRYEVVIAPSQRFKRLMPRLLDVPGFDGILIHPGNTAKDTAGCILVGQVHGMLEGKPAVLRSRAAFDALFPKLERAIQQGPCWLTITSAPPDSGKET